MGAIFVGLRPYDDKLLRQLATARGCRPQDLAGIYLERAIRRAGAPPPEEQADTDRPSASLAAAGQT